MKEHLVIVPGGLNTDVVGLGVDRLISAGELTLGGKLKIGPGGKARNMAQMAAAYLGKNKVAMVGRSSRDPFGLWEIPLKSLKNAGVDTAFVKVLGFEEACFKYPGIALIPVDKQGRNQIYVLPGVNADFCRKDIDDAAELFENRNKKKIMILALEIPLETARYCIEKAALNGIRVILDPGGVKSPLEDILNESIFLLKPNEHEAKILTGLSIRDFKSARKAAAVLLSKGFQNVLISHGANGVYLFTQKTSLHLSCPEVEDTGIYDETGCGDQVTATVAACLAEGKNLVEAAKMSVLAGTLQFHRQGIQPISREELLRNWSKLKSLD
jgi:ribokinase